MITPKLIHSKSHNKKLSSTLPLFKKGKTKIDLLFFLLPSSIIIFFVDNLFALIISLELIEKSSISLFTPFIEWEPNEFEFICL